VPFIRIPVKHGAWSGRLPASESDCACSDEETDWVEPHDSVTVATVVHV